MAFLSPLIGVVMLLMVQTETAFAHAMPLQTEPTSSSVALSAPDGVRIRFSGRIDSGASSITVFAPDGSIVSDAPAVVDPNDAHIFSVTARLSASGTYAASWRVVSADDGHFSQGGFLFSVGAESIGEPPGTGGFVTTHSSNWPQVIMKWVELLGEAILVAALAFVPWLWRRMKQERVSGESAEILIRRLQMLIRLAAALTVAGAAGFLLLAASQLAIGQSLPLKNALGVLVTTVSARYALIRLGAVAVWALAYVLMLRPILSSARFTKKEAALWVLGIVILLLRARVSHAAASSFFPLFSIAINATHLFFKDLWIGGLVVFVCAYLPALDKRGSTRLSVRSLLRFSDLLLLSLAGGGATGAYIVWLHLKNPANLLATHWGAYSITLVGFATVLLALRLYQQNIVYRHFLPFCRGTPNHTDRTVTASAGALLFFEAIVGLAVLLFSSRVLLTTPPFLQRAAYAQAFQTPTAVLTLSEHPYDRDQFLVTVVRKERPWATSGSSLTLLLSNSDKNIGPIVAETKKRFEGGFTFPKQSLSPPGLWTLEVTEQQSQVYDATGSFTFRYPEDVSAVHVQDGRRIFDAFALCMVVGVCGLLMLAYACHRRNRLRDRECRESGKSTPLPSLSPSRLWLLLPLDLAIVILIGLQLGTHGTGAAAFHGACERAGGTWMEHVPMERGTMTSDIPVLGCMIGSGRDQSHIADARELAYRIGATQ